MGLSLLASFDVSSFFSLRQDHWDECVLFFEFAYNNSVNPSTGHSPFILSYAQSPRFPCQFLDSMLPEDVSLVDASQHTKLSVTQLASSLGLDIINNVLEGRDVLHRDVHGSVYHQILVQ
jgi:hypothetical protein